MEKLLETADSTLVGGSGHDGETGTPDAEDLEGDFEEALNDLRTYTSCLMDLVPSLERSDDNVKSARSQALGDVEFIVSEPADWFVMKIRDRFPKSSGRLAERFGEANWRRYVRVNQIREGFRSGGSIDLQEKSVFQPSSMFHDSGLGTSHSSLASSAADRDGGRARVPDTPVEALKGKPFPCEICGKVVENVRDRTSWK